MYLHDNYWQQLMTAEIIVAPRWPSLMSYVTFDLSFWVALVISTP
jgi:hypothetical protein